MSDETIDVRVTPALHPRNVQEIEGYDDETANLLGPTKTAFSEAYNAIGAVHDARAAAAKNPTWNEASQLIQVDDFAQKQFTRIAAKFDHAAANLKMIIGGIEKELTTPVENKAGQMVAGEIRSYVASLPEGQRMSFVMRAITENDVRTATAILGAPAYLSGITADMQAVLTRRYHEHHHPLQAKRLKAAQGALTLIGDRSGLVFSQLSDAVGAPPHKVAKLRAAKTAAEKHFAAREA